jgi:alpha/beta superfamily hydrolase
MHNKVVFRAARGLNDAGLIALRINFRGVGQSTGVHDMGQGEQEDVMAGLKYLQENYPDQTVTVCGFSFGARVGIEVGMDDDRVRNLISIGTPVDKYDFSFLKNCQKPILFVHGEHDEFGDLDALKALVNEVSANNSSVELAVVPGAGHFFDDQLEELRRIVAQWIRKQLDRE